ncbi:unnamed protein product, partial [Amoebophrya sp. A120]|eukprot:GSA120T00003418001.1
MRHFCAARSVRHAAFAASAVLGLGSLFGSAEARREDMCAVSVGTSVLFGSTVGRRDFATAVQDRNVDADETALDNAETDKVDEAFPPNAETDRVPPPGAFGNSEEGQRDENK